MTTSRKVPLSIAALALPTLLLTACGANSERQLQSITLTPSTATAAGAEGTIQFVATGHYNQDPYTVTPLPASWSYTGPMDGQITLKQDGQAACKAGQAGSFTVAAWIEPKPGGSECLVIGPGGAPCESVAGTAQLTCP